MRTGLTSARLTADLAKLLAEREIIEALDRQINENAKTITQISHRRDERFFFVYFGTLDRGWVLNPPMRGHWLPRPRGADLPRRVVADGEHEIQYGCSRCGEFIPALGAQSLSRKFHLLEQTQRNRVYGVPGIATG